MLSFRDRFEVSPLFSGSSICGYSRHCGGESVKRSSQGNIHFIIYYNSHFLNGKLHICLRFFQCPNSVWYFYIFCNISAEQEFNSGTSELWRLRPRLGVGLRSEVKTTVIKICICINLIRMFALYLTCFFIAGQQADWGKMGENWAEEKRGR